MLGKTLTYDPNYVPSILVCILQNFDDYEVASNKYKFVFYNFNIIFNKHKLRFLINYSAMSHNIK